MQAQLFESALGGIPLERRRRSSRNSPNLAFEFRQAIGPSQTLAGLSDGERCIGQGIASDTGDRALVARGRKPTRTSQGFECAQPQTLRYTGASVREQYWQCTRIPGGDQPCEHTLHDMRLSLLRSFLAQNVEGAQRAVGAEGVGRRRLDRRTPIV